MIKRILSYFTPIIEKKIPSKVSQQLEVTWIDGHLVVDTKHTNYSYGNLEKVLKNGLSFIGFEKIKNMDKVLILGLGAGGVLKTLRDEVKYLNAIDSVELDEAILFIGKKYFGIEQYSTNHTIHNIDAFEFVLRSKEQYDLIIIDIFQDAKMPDFLFERYFVEQIQKILNPKGFILFNTIVLTEEDENRNEQFYTLFPKENYSIRSYPKQQKYNVLLTIKKLQ
ncbi:spermidine synthase [Myroides profundi]|uniref:Spermidine synthase n=1 Tax=Myroides profundi TaxID=480520 RepID=A0AAJ4W1Q1_MYRPR|nr:spermidine synthase [Myroides profundi]AJH14872.1 spermidine synthase [Myroides profundi]SEQ25969.1 spermidine synthase [Myroides profundi]